MTESPSVRVLTAQDATAWKIPADPQISPSGDRVAFTLSDVAKPDEHGRSSIWLIDIQKRTTQPFTAGPREDRSPVWSPDGTLLAFTSDREEAGTHQLYVMPVSGGEARRLTQCRGGVSSPRWSPDGTLLAFVATDAETEEEAERKKERRDHIVVDEDLRYDRLYLVPSGGGEAHRVSPPGAAHVAGYEWMPDGAQLVANLTEGPTADQTFHGPSHLVLIPARGEGTARQRTILRCADGLSAPLPSPDGATIAFRGRARRVHSANTIYLVPTAGGEARPLNAGYGGTISSMVWSPEGDELRFVGSEDLWGVVRAVNVSTGEMRSLFPETQSGAYGQGLSFDRAGRRVAVVGSWATRPAEVMVGTVGADLEVYTQVNERLAAYPYAPSEAISWNSPDGTEIHGLLIRPVRFRVGERYPMVVHIHGGPAAHWSDRFMANWHDWAQLLAQRGYVVLLPNPRGSTGRGVDFMEAEVNDLGGGEFADMMSGVDHVLRLGFVDPDRLGVGGWSHGGYMTAWTVTQTDRFKCAVMGAGLSNLVSDQGQNDVPRMNDDYFDGSAYADIEPYMQRSAVTFIRRATTPTLILHGEKDERVALPQAREMYRGLKWAGVPTQLVIYPREPHGIGEQQHQIDLIERVLAWFDQYLGRSN